MLSDASCVFCRLDIDRIKDLHASDYPVFAVGRPHTTIQRSPLGRSVVTALEAEMDQVASPLEPTAAKTGSPGGGGENENEAASGYTSQDTGPGGLTPGHSGSATPAGFERSSFASGRPQTATPDTSPTKGRKGAFLRSCCADILRASQQGSMQQSSEQLRL